MSILLRYDSDVVLTSPLDPIEDICSWISGLRSQGYTADILRAKHGLSTASELRQSAEIIGLFAKNAIGFIDQAYSGPHEVVFLPLYYALLNISKIYVAASGRLKQLAQYRYHGASYNPSEKLSRDLLTEHVSFRTTGVLQQFYESITNRKWPTNVKRLSVSHLYPLIQSIGYEYNHAYGRPSALQPISVEIVGDSLKGFWLNASLSKTPHPHSATKRYIKFLTGLSLAGDPKKFQYKSNAMKAAGESVYRQVVSRTLPRYLLYQVPGPLGNLSAVTPLSSMHLLFPEELPIWLAFFHMSNVVRYNPEFLSRLMDSKCWPMLLCHSKHGVFKFMLLFWSFFHNANYNIISA